MDERSILNCQIASWYSAFERVTYRTRLIELPDAFVEYLLQDGVYLPEESAAVLPSLKYAGTRQALPARCKENATEQWLLFPLATTLLVQFCLPSYLVKNYMCPAGVCREHCMPCSCPCSLLMQLLHAQLPARHKPDEYSDYQDWAEEDTEPPEAEGADGKVCCSAPLPCRMLKSCGCRVRYESRQCAVATAYN